MKPEVQLQDLWADAERRFQETTKQKLRRNGEPKTLDDILQDINQRGEDDDSSAAKSKQKVMQTTLKILKCIHILGGIVAQAASTVGDMDSSQGLDGLKCAGRCSVRLTCVSTLSLS